MSSKHWKNGTNVAVRTLLAIALIFSQSALAGQNQSSRTTTDSSRKTASQQPSNKQPAGEQDPRPRVGGREGEVLENSLSETNTSSSGPQEGIKVHGHWTIEVRNPDGKVVTHREFENSLVPGPFLSSVLGRTATVGPWEVALAGNVCVTGNCYLFENQSIPGISLTSSISGSNFVLNGLVAASNSGSVTGVVTFVWLCPPSSAPSSQTVGGACNNAVNSPNVQFTGTTLATPIQVSAGQTIAVTVNFSFS